MTELDKAIKQLQKDYTGGVIMDLSNDDSIPKVPRFPVTSPNVGDVLGDGGIPVGKIIEIYGLESSGKTTFCYYLAGQVQKAKVKFIDKNNRELERDGKVAFIDAEYAFDPSWALKQGFNIHDAILVQPDYGEQALDVAEKLASTHMVDLIVVDSVAGLTPLAELEGSMEDQQMGAMARMMGKGMRKLVALANRTGCTIIFINQIRQKIGVYGNPNTTTGGNALKFFSSIRLSIRSTEMMMDGDTPIGIKSEIKGVKNKTSLPMIKKEIEIMFADGINPHREWLSYAVSLGLIDKGGAWYTLPNGDKLHGMEKVATYYEENPDEYDTLVEAVKTIKYPDADTHPDVVEIKEKTDEEIAKDEAKMKELSEKYSE